MALTEWWDDAGVPGDMRVKPPVAEAQPSAPTFTKKPDEPQKVEPRRLRIDPIREATKLAASADSPITLKNAVSGFNGCDLKLTARNTVLFDGAPNADIMLIGEAPGVDEDKQGKPFVGRSGQLLDRMFATISHNRQTSLYITNVLPWRPPGNRDPSPDEIAVCKPFLERQIELVSPKLIVTVGRISTQAVLGGTQSILKVRGKQMTYRQPSLGADLPCIPFLHPAYILRRPAEKSKAWRDLLIIDKIASELGAQKAK